MKYKDYEGPIEDLVIEKIKEIEKSENVRIIHAVESGSRSWGFASPDSDYDVRFIYVRDKNFYMSLRATKDVIDWELDEVLDINGWDIKKALQLFHKSNATLFEWANSPIVYYTTDEWKEIYEKVEDNYFSHKSTMYHYYGTAKSNYMQNFTGERVKCKKYFYVLRPLLACKWIEEKKCPPPVAFAELVDSLKEKNVADAINELVKVKVTLKESDTVERVKLLDDFIESEFARFEELIPKMDDDRNPDWDVLDEIFRNL